MAVSGGLQFLKPEDIISKLNLAEGMRVADFGCGNIGYFILPLAKLVGKEGIAYAVDIQKQVLNAVSNKAKLELLSNLETVWGNLEKAGSISIPKNSLNIGLLINVLFQNKDHQAILQEVSRLIKSGGQLLIVDWKKTGAPFGPPVDARVDSQQIKAIAAQQKFSLIEEMELGNYFWGLLFSKN